MKQLITSLPLDHWLFGFWAGTVFGIILVILHDLFVIRPQRLKEISHYRRYIPEANDQRDRGDRL